MNIQLERLRIRGIDAASANKPDELWSIKGAGLNVETRGPCSLLPYQQKCSIRFDADGNATIDLGMRDPGWANASTYFANIVVARLGIPFTKVRLYYTGAHPAARRTPKQLPFILTRTNVDKDTTAIGDLIEKLCDRAIDCGRRFLAGSTGVSPGHIEFNASTSRFYIVSNGNQVDFLEAAKQARCGCQPHTV